MASISTRERTGVSAQGVDYTEFNIQDGSGRAPLIRVEDDFVGALEQHILADLGRSRESAAGVLLGIEARGALRITGFQPLATAGLRSLQNVVNETKAGMGPANTVGFYRASRQANHLISRDDLVRFRERFGSGRALFLQVRLFDGQAPTGVFYLGEKGSLLSDRRSAEWPVNLQALGAGEASPEPAADQEVRIGKSRRWREFWRWLIASAAVAFTVTVLWSLWPLARRQPAKEARGAAAPAPVASSPAVEADASVKKAVEAPPGASGGRNATVAAKASRPGGAPAQTSIGHEGRGLRRAAAAVPAVRAEPDSRLNAPEQNPSPARREVAVDRLTQPPAARARVVPDPEAAGVRPPADPSGVEYRPRVQVTPAISPAMLRQIQGYVMVSVRVDIDEAGNVISAAPISANPGIQSELAAAIADAVLRWQFEPAREGGRAVRGQTVLHFKYINP
jgi:TonB family protein